MIIRFFENNELTAIAKLSKAFANENCCNGIVADNVDYFRDKKVAVVIDNGEIIGYGYGTFDLSKKNKSYIRKNEKLFYIEEMYVVKNKRNLGVGIKLFQFLEDYAKTNGANIIELNAVSKDYNKLLNFYIKKLNMNFLSAYLYKKI